MTRDGVNIWEHGMRHPVKTNIAYRPLIYGDDHWPECVSEFEEREAAVYCQYSPVQFYGLAVEERARCVAQYRIQQMVESHIQDAVIEAGERKSRK